MAEPSKEKDIADVLKNIREEMMKRKQLLAQKEGNQELKKLNSTLSKDKVAQPTVKFPSGEDIARALIKSSPIFDRSFGGWMKDTINYAQASNQELSGINKELQRTPKNSGEELSVEYLDMMSDQLKNINYDINEGLSNSIKRLDGIESVLTGMSTSLVDSNNDNFKRTISEDRLQLKAIYDLNGSVKSGVGRIVGELVRMRDDNTRNNEKLLMRTNEEGKDSGKSNPKAGVVLPTPERADDSSSGGGFLAGAGLMAGIGVLKKLMGAPLALIRGFSNLFSGFGGIVKLLKSATKFIRVGPIALLTAIWDFGKGFFNAKEILGKSEVTILDRVKAGISELLGGFGDLFDWVAKIFGFDTDVGKSIREGFLEIAKKPFEMAQSVVDWFKNDLFGGIDMSTSLVDIPGIIADNLQKELIKLVTWIGEGLAGILSSAKDTMSGWVEDLKKGFNDKIKKPFYNMINSVLDAVFNVVDKFVELIPDAFGGEEARKKMQEARANWKVGEDDQPESTTMPPTANKNPSPELSAPSRAIELPTQAATVGPLEVTPIIPMSATTPTYGKAAVNTQDIKTAQQQQTTVNMPVSQVKNNVNNSKNTTVLNSQSLQPSNNQDSGRELWNY